MYIRGVPRPPETTLASPVPPIQCRGGGIAQVEESVFGCCDDDW